MRYSKDHKQRTRERIIQAAGGLFRKRGYQASGVDAVMKSAGLTHGGFYTHFKNKEDLFAEVTRETIRRSGEAMRHHLDGLSGAAWLRGWVTRYLSNEHMCRVDQGCAGPPLLSEISRAGAGPKRAFEEVFLELRELMVQHQQTTRAEAERRAAAAVSLAMGAMCVARAMHEQTLAEHVLDAGRESAIAILLGTDAGRSGGDS